MSEQGIGNFMSDVYTFSDLLFELFICYVIHGLPYLIVPSILKLSSKKISRKAINAISFFNGFVIFFILVLIHYGINSAMPSWIAAIIWGKVGHILLKKCSKENSTL